MRTDITEQIHDLNIVDVISSYTTHELKKAGTIYKMNCPFHDEKTPSFTITPAKGIFKCFGCGKGGDAITFVMEHENLPFWEAVKDITNRFNLKLPDIDPGQKKKYEQKQRHQEALKIVNEFAKDHFMRNITTLEVIQHRVSGKMIERFEVGYAPNRWDDLKNAAEKMGYKQHLLIEAGLLKNNDGKVYDRFRGRIIFPVYNYRGRIIGFSGRDITGEQSAKYINTPTSDVFEKGRELFGLFQSKKAIQKANHAYLVEGNTDVTTLHGIGIENTVAPLGTAFTNEQAQLLKKFCDTVTIVGDGDENGQKAVVKNAQILIAQGFVVNVITLPEEKDPDDYFSAADQFLEYERENRQDFIFWYASTHMGDGKDPHIKAKGIQNVCSILATMENIKADLYLDQLGNKYKPKKQWKDQIAQLRSEQTSQAGENVPDHVDPDSLQRYGFYEDRNRYFFRTREESYYPVSNFIMRPLFHIKLINESSRLFEIENVYGHKEIIEIDMQSMVSLQNFRKIIEGRGNFLFEGNEQQFMRLKRKLYDETKTCELIENLGWQPQGFFAFSNGIFNGQWKPVDSKGIVENSGKYYFIPALSDIYKDDKTIYQSERKFQYIERNDVDISTWSKQLISVFGDNAKIAICFYLATIFKDYISQQFKFFPILNAFGPPGTGKSQLGWSMMYLFGEAQFPYNLHNGTKVGLAEHLAEFSNAFAWIDEYKNAVDYDKIEMLKSAYDLIGRKKGGIEKGKKTKTSTVNAGIILTGQEMPTADVALLKRVILLQFYKNEFTEKEQQEYDRLKEMEKAGLSHFLLEFLQYREQFEKEYFKIYDQVSSDLGKDLEKIDVEDRIFRNMVIIVAAFYFFEDKVNLNMTYDEIRKLAAQNIIDQSSFIMNSAEIKSFWDTVESAVENAHLTENKDFKFDQVNQLTVEGSKEPRDFGKIPKKIIYLKFSRIYEVYAETMRRTGQHALPKTTLIFYLKTSKEFIGIRKSVRFEDHVTNAYVFDYEKLNIHLERSPQGQQSNNQNSYGSERSDKNVEVEENDQGELPF